MRSVLTFDPAAAFEVAFDDEIGAVEEAQPGTVWTSAGKASKEYPDGENQHWWRQNGPGMVSAWVNWRQSTGWDIWTLPDGSPAIEVELQPKIGPVIHRMIIDRVMVASWRRLVVVDLKSGRNLPPGDMQLGLYKVGIEQTFGVRVAGGAYWDARKGQMSAIKRLDHFTPELFAAYAERFIASRRAGVFLPNITSLCKGCGMNRFCAAVGGAQSHLDPDYQLMRGNR